MEKRTVPLLSKERGSLQNPGMAGCLREESLEEAFRAGGCTEGECREGERRADTRQRRAPGGVSHFPTAQEDLQGANQAGGSSSWGTFSSPRGDGASIRQGRPASSHRGDAVSSRLGGGVPSHLGDAANRRGDHPSLVVGVLLLPSRVVQALFPIHEGAVGPILQVEADPTRLAEGDLLGPIRQVALVAIPQGGPNHQVEGGPSLGAADGLLGAGAPTYLEGPC